MNKLLHIFSQNKINSLNLAFIQSFFDSLNKDIIKLICANKNDGSLKDILQKIRIRKEYAQSIVIDHGEKGEELFILLDGAVKVSQPNEEQVSIRPLKINKEPKKPPEPPKEEEEDVVEKD